MVKIAETSMSHEAEGNFRKENFKKVDLYGESLAIKRNTVIDLLILWQAICHIDDK